MAVFCTNCGNRLGDGVKFCPGCGARIEGQPQAQQPVFTQGQTYGQTQYAQLHFQEAAVYAGNGPVRIGIPAPGFSDRVNDPEIVAAVKKNRGAAKIFAAILVPIPVLGLVIYSLVSGQMELGNAALTGGIISAVLLVFAIFGFVRDRTANSYEATVVDRISRVTYRHSNSGDRDMVTEYKTVVQTLNGKRKKIVEYEGSQIWAWNYLKSGDRFRYHPQFVFPYELYDKSRAPYIACVSCGTENPVEADRCSRCKIPLLK